MSVVPSVFLIIAAIPGLLGSGAHAPAGWKLFQSRSQHFSVRYPASWHQIKAADGRVDNDRLSIINFPNAEIVSGVIIKKNGASIGVNGAPANVRTTEDWIRMYPVDDTLLDDRDIAVGKPAAGGCVKLSCLVIRDEVGPSAYSIDTRYFCSTTQGLYVVTLTNWEGDPHQSALQDIALKIALSLRLH